MTHRNDTHESRTERISLAVTPSEKRAVVAVSALRETDASNLCRVLPIAEIVNEYRRLQARTRIVVPQEDMAA